MTTRYPWYWAWRGWRASTWLFLLWSALMWPEIVTLLREEDAWLDDLAAALVIYWLLGVWFLGMARAFASLDRVLRPAEAASSSAVPPCEPRPRSPRSYSSAPSSSASTLPPGEPPE